MEIVLVETEMRTIVLHIVSFRLSRDLSSTSAGRVRELIVKGCVLPVGQILDAEEIAPQSIL